MKRMALAGLMVLGMVSVAQAQMGSETGVGSNRSDACANAKSKAKDFIIKGYSLGVFNEIQSFGLCECSDTAENSNNRSTSWDRWKCNVDYRYGPKHD